MQHITFADKSLLLGDDAAMVLLEYAAALAAKDLADTVTMNAISSDGDAVEATFLLNSGTPLMAESSTAEIPEPDNADTIARMVESIRLLKFPPHAIAEARDESDFDSPMDS
jgi:hypothetical protein